MIRRQSGDNAGAEEAYRDAIAMEPLDPQAHMNLALLLARQGNTPGARQEVELALKLFAPDQRDLQRTLFEQVLDASSHPADTPSP